MTEWSIVLDCKSSAFGLRRFESSPAHQKKRPCGRFVAQGEPHNCLWGVRIRNAGTLCVQQEASRGGAQSEERDGATRGAGESLPDGGRAPLRTNKNAPMKGRCGYCRWYSLRIFSEMPRARIASRKKSADGRTSRTPVFGSTPISPKWESFRSSHSKLSVSVQ